MATTTNYGWTTPDNTDAVTNGALAIRTLGSAVDTTVAGLNPKWVSSGIYVNGQESGNHSQTDAKHVTFVPFVVPNNVTLASMSVSVSDSATATSYLGVYSANSTTLMPDALIASFGSFSGSTTGVKTVSTTQALTAGLYWFAVKLNQITSYAVDSAVNPTAFNPVFGYAVSTFASLVGNQLPNGVLYIQAASGALEATAGTLVSSITTAPFVGIEVA